MPYFILLPGYVGFLVLMTLAIIALRASPTWRPWSGYVAGALVGSCPGFLVANAVCLLGGVLSIQAAQNGMFPEWLQQTFALAAAAILFVGPFVALAAGVALGSACGLYFVARRRRKMSGSSPCAEGACVVP